MTWHVAFLPGEVAPGPNTICIVVDVLRATSSIAVMLDSGVERVFIAETPEMALGWKEADWLVAGEVGGLPPVGFDLGNSPVELRQSTLRGRTVILSTSNGTRAIRASRPATILTGALVNRRAVVEAAMAAHQDVIVVCAGTKLATEVTLEDVYAAGRIVTLAAEMGATLADSAKIAARLAGTFSSARQAFETADHGQTLIGIGLGPDLDACAEEDAIDVVPVLVPGDMPALVKEERPLRKR